MLEPCSPGERNAIAVTLTELAEKGMAAQASLQFLRPIVILRQWSRRSAERSLGSGIAVHEDLTS